MMRAALWFVGLFALAVAVALFAGNNQGVVSLFWHPYRVDLSLNMVLMVLLLVFTVGYAAMRALSALVMLPHQAKRWRQQQKERQMYQALVDSMSHLQAGRYVRARKSAQSLIKLSDELRQDRADVPQDAALRAMAHMLAADSAHALRDVEGRNQHYTLAIDDVPHNGTLQQQEVREGAQMRAARWALDDRDPQEALLRLSQLPPGASRRTMALRIQLKASRLAQETEAALDTARLLAKHGALSPESAASITSGLILEQLQHTHDAEQLTRIWKALPAADQQLPDVALAAARRLIDVQGDAALARAWLLPVWERYVAQPDSLSSLQIQRLFMALQQSMEGLDAAWLARIEAAQRAAPQEARLQYLAGMACVQRQLWGKAEQLLGGAMARLHDKPLRASAWKALAIMAEQREDATAAAQAWREAALIAS